MFAVIGNALPACHASALHTAGDVRFAPPRRRKLLGAIRRRQPEAARRAMQEMLAGWRGDAGRHAGTAEAA